MKRLLKSAAMRNFIILLASGYVRLIHRFGNWQRITPEHVGDILERGAPVIALVWHGRLFMAPVSWLGFPIPVNLLVSRHGDGELIAGTLHRFGLDTVRGSTAKAGKSEDKGGAAALRQMLRLLRDGQCVGITPDGPRGPRMQLSDGVVQLARMSGVPVVPISYAARHRLVLGSWDRFNIPLPFSSGAIIYGEPIEVPREMDAAEQEAMRLRIEAALNAVTWEADALYGHDPVQPAEAKPVPAEPQEATP